MNEKGLYDWLFGVGHNRKVPTANPIPGTAGIPQGTHPSRSEIAERVVTGEEAAEFLRGETVLFVHSSNVESLAYKPGEQKLLVSYLSGGTYEYSNISTQEAQQFLTSGSKGRAVWDFLRVRGSRTAHRKPYRKLS